MARFKPDTSFFRKTVIGASGTQAVSEDLRTCGHDMVELERGSMHTKIWKEVKRKRVRIPDLICKNCGRRVESRAKTKPELSMSHSDREQERSWDYGMVPEDWIAFPISICKDNRVWTRGILRDQVSYWHERDWSGWNVEGKINYFTVDTFRRIAPDTSSRKGVTEGSELTLTWDAKFTTCSGQVEAIEGKRIRIRPESGRVRTLRVRPELRAHVRVGDTVTKNQVLFSGPVPVVEDALRCPGSVGRGFLEQCLRSRERTVRFGGVKLSRLGRVSEHADFISGMARDSQEDLYVRLEALAYSAEVEGLSVSELFERYLRDPDPQVSLESVITIGEIGTRDASEVLGSILHDQGREYFMRSAAAWALGNVGGSEAKSI